MVFSSPDSGHNSLTDCCVFNDKAIEWLFHWLKQTENPMNWFLWSHSWCLKHYFWHGQGAINKMIFNARAQDYVVHYHKWNLRVQQHVCPQKSLSLSWSQKSEGDHRITRHINTGGDIKAQHTGIALMQRDISCDTRRFPADTSLSPFLNS